ncbi:MAG: helicase, partial [Solirubrobacterales bacterium]
MSYADFLGSKAIVDEPSGFDVEVTNEGLFDWQREVVRWSLGRGRAAVFADTGLGKTRIQLEWAERVARHTGGRVLILAPLAVSAQTRREGQAIGIEAAIVREAGDCGGAAIEITNYERLERFLNQEWAGLVLDESSILKAYDGKTRRAITEFAQAIPYRLACTATPAPNDQSELTSHGEFLGVMRRDEIIGLFFTQDGNSSSRYRLKGHSRKDFYRWLASWAVAIRRPSDIGYADEGFDLPPLEIEQHVV